MSFLGAIVTDGDLISRVRLTSGINTLMGNGVLSNPNGHFVAMDDFVYGEPAAAVPEPSSLAMLGCGLACITVVRRRSKVTQAL